MTSKRILLLAGVLFVVGFAGEWCGVGLYFDLLSGRPVMEAGDVVAAGEGEVHVSRTGPLVNDPSTMVLVNVETETASLWHLRMKLGCYLGLLLAAPVVGVRWSRRLPVGRWLALLAATGWGTSAVIIAVNRMSPQATSANGFFDVLVCVAARIWMGAPEELTFFPGIVATLLLAGLLRALGSSVAPGET